MSFNPSRGFSNQDLQNFQQTIQPQQQQQQQAVAPQRNWRYANRTPQAMSAYSPFNNYQTDWKAQIYNPNIANRPAFDEMESLRIRKEEERQRQLDLFQQKWQAQQQGTTSHDYIIREGIWARSPDTATQQIPWPIHAQQWKGEEEFLNNLEVVEAYMANQKIFYRDGIKCIVKDCGADLHNAEFVDQVNKVSWPVSFIHYLGDHNNPPSRFFYDYIRKASAAIRQLHPQ